MTTETTTITGTSAVILLNVDGRPLVLSSSLYVFGRGEALLRKSAHWTDDDVSTPAPWVEIIRHDPGGWDFAVELRAMALKAAGATVERVFDDE